MEHLLGWNWDAQWDSHEHPGSCTAIRSLGCLWSNGWVRASNGRHLPTGALPWEWMASALQGWVFSLVLEALGSVLLCEVKCMGPGCSLQLGLRSMLRQLLGQMSLHPERGIVHEWNWGFCSLFICSSKFSKQPMGLVPYAQDLKTRMASLWLNLFMTKSGCHLWALPFPLSSILRAQFPTQSLFFPTYLITWDLSKSLDYIRFLQPTSRYILVRSIPHVDEFLLCSLGTVSSTSSYSATLISPRIHFMLDQIIAWIGYVNNKPGSEMIP